MADPSWKFPIDYFSSLALNEYKGFISYMQEQLFLADEVEDLKLEKLQVTSGIKAIRAVSR